MSRRLVIATLAVATVMPATTISFSTVAAAQSLRERQERIERRAQQEWGRRKDAIVKQRNRDSSDSIRANALDAAGDYRSYPDWARAALSPKDNEGG